MVSVDPRRRRRHARRLGLVALAGLLAAVLPGTPALAHSQLQHTFPADGTSITSPVSQVTLTFNEMVRGTFTTVVVAGPGNRSYSDGHVKVIDDDVFQAVYPLKSGPYTVSWRAISADGHPVDGQFHFSVSLPANEEPAAYPPLPASASTGSSDGWLIWAGLAVALALAFVAFKVLARRPASSDDRLVMADDDSPVPVVPGE